jgi:hypothetical protein
MSMLTERTCAGVALCSAKWTAKQGDGRDVTALGDEHDPALGGIGNDGQIMMAAPVGGLIDRHRGHR